MGYELILAIYGAVVSTAVAVIQVTQYFEGKRYIHVRAERSLGTDQEYMIFRIANRSAVPVELQEVFAYNLGFAAEIGFHELGGRSVDIFKDDNGSDDEGKDGDEDTERSKPLSIPFKLGSGESVCVFFSSADAKAVTLPAPDNWTGSINSNLFLLEVSHARGDEPTRLYFEMDEKYLSRAYSNWLKLVPRRRRFRFRPIDKVYR